MTNQNTLTSMHPHYLTDIKPQPAHFLTKTRPWRWAPLPIGALLGNLGEGSYAGGLCAEESSGMGVPPYRGPIGGPGEGEMDEGDTLYCTNISIQCIRD